MLNHLSGKLTEKSPTHAVIECSGVGYFVNISLHTYAKIGSGENCRLLVHMSVKEDAHLLFGFMDEEERRIFRQLISVSGIGETTARMMLSSLSPNEIQQAIISGNASLLQSIKGIGAKTAQRAIIDLQDKIKKGEMPSGIPEVNFAAGNKIKEQALSALMTLGFSKQAIEKVLFNLMRERPNATVEELIKLALNQL